MKKSKLLCSLISVVVVMLNMIIVLYAESNASVTLSNVNAKRGDTVEIIVSLSGSPDANTLGISLDYDKTVLELVPANCKWIPTTGLISDFDESKDMGAWASASTMNLNGDVFIISFKVKDNAPLGKSDVGCNLIVKNGSTIIQTTVTKGSVTVDGNNSYNPWSLTKNPTTNTTGILTRTSVNDSSQTETFTLPTLNTINGYTYSVISAATCTTAGNGRYTYVKDSQSFKFDVSLPAIGHNYGQWSVTKNPTITETGTLTRICANDSKHTETFTLPALNTSNGYTYSIITATTYTANGTGRYTYVKESQTFTFDISIPAEDKNDNNSNQPQTTKETNVATVSEVDSQLNDNSLDINTNIDITEELDNAANKGIGLNIEYIGIKIYFDPNAVQSLKKNNCTNISIVKISGSTTTESNYIMAGFDINNCSIYEIKIEKSFLDSGYSTISIPYSGGGKNTQVYYVDSFGNKTNMEATYDKSKGLVSFSTNHFSTYVITNEPDNTDNYLIFILAAVIILIIIMDIVAVIKRKSKTKHL